MCVWISIKLNMNSNDFSIKSAIKQYTEKLQNTLPFAIYYII